MTVKRIQKENTGSASEQVQSSVSDGPVVNFLGIEFNSRDFQDNLRSGWRARLLGPAKSLEQLILLAVPDEAQAEPLRTLIQHCEKKLRRDPCSFPFSALNEMGSDKEVGEETLGGLARVSLTCLLPEMVACLPGVAETFLQRLARDMQVSIDDPNVRPIDFFYSAIEIPLVLSASLKRLERGHALGSEAIETLGVFLESNFDSEGWIAVGHLNEWALLLAALLRVQRLIKISKHSIPTKVSERIEWIGRQFVRSLNAEGQLVLGEGVISDPQLLLKLIGRASGDREDRAIARERLGRSGKAKPRKSLPDASDVNESSSMGVLRSTWRPKSPRVAFLCRGHDFQWELGAARSLIAGNCWPQLSCNGVAVDLGDEPLTLNCWETSDEISFLELQRFLPNQMTWQRQVFLARKDNFAMISDTFFLQLPQENLEYRCQWPLANGMALLQESETREVYFTQGERIVALGIPITLGEWKTDRSGNTFEAGDGTLNMVQRGKGRALFSAMVIDLDPRRSRRPRTWRKLAVGENLENVADDVAVARRFQLDHHQWVVYRNLSSVGNRTFIGQNVFCDFCVLRLRPDGSVKKLLEIE